MFHNPAQKRSVQKRINDEPRPYIFVDTETTGLDPCRHEIWEIGAVKQYADGEEEELDIQLNLLHENTGSPDALEICNFYERYRPSESVPVEEGLERFLEFSRDGVIFGLNISFDISFFRALAREHNLDFQPEWYYSIIDVKSYSAGVLGISPLVSATRLAELLDVSVMAGKRHSALGDAYLTADIYSAAKDYKKSYA